MAGLILAASRHSATGQTVEIPDTGLKSAIWGTLSRPLPVGTVTVPDLLSLTNLMAENLGITTLEGLGEAHQLTRLSLSFNQLTSLILPAGLTNLTELY